MALIGTMYQRGDYRILFLIDPNRYRMTIWAPSSPDDREIYARHVRTMVDKDEHRLRQRVLEWIDKHPLEVV